MRYMHKKIHFNKSELQELEKRNPTLFDLAKYVADKAHITARVMGKNWVNVTRGNDETQLFPNTVTLICALSATYLARSNSVGLRFSSSCNSNLLKCILPLM